MGGMKGPGSPRGHNSERRARPEHFSTYVPRGLVRRLKVVATIRDVPLWALVTRALEDYLDAFQNQHGQLPALDDERKQAMAAYGENYARFYLGDTSRRADIPSLTEELESTVPGIFVAGELGGLALIRHEDPEAQFDYAAALATVWNHQGAAGPITR